MMIAWLAGLLQTAPSAAWAYQSVVFSTRAPLLVTTSRTTTHRTPMMVSGGQQQRVAIARAVINRPRLILADEPTGNLDSESASGVVELLLRCAREWGASVVLVTHDPLVSERADRAIRLHSGHLEGT
jgi:ABC-type lipoprotein export system ATPase subunit